jgi:hypothetical protein
VNMPCSGCTEASAKKGFWSDTFWNVWEFCNFLTCRP